MQSKSILKVFMVFVFQLFFMVSQSFAVEYTYEKIQYPGALSTTISGINDNGTMVGTARIDLGGYYENRGFQYSAGTFQDLPSAGTCSSGGLTRNVQVYSTDINNNNQIVGQTQSCGRYRGFLLNGNIYTQISSTNSAAARGLNNAGKVVGSIGLATTATNGFIFENAYLSTFNYPNAVRTSLIDINDDGFILGSASNVTGGDIGEFIYDPNTFQFFPFNIPTGEALSSVEAFNDMGQIIGIIVTNGGADRTGFVYDELQGFQPIAFPGATGWTIPEDINNKGEIVGYYSSAGDSGAFIARPSTPPVLLSLPIPYDTYNAPFIQLSMPAISAELSAESYGAYAVADFNNGGTNDLMLAHPISGKIIVYLGENISEGLFNDAKTMPIITSAADLAVGDFDNDGFKDAVLGSRDCQGDTTNFPVMRGLGNADFVVGTCLSISENTGYQDSYVNSTAVGDVNGDGNDDIIVSRSGNYGEKAVYLYLGNGDFTFAPRTVIYSAGTSTYRPYRVEVYDMNEDGYLDILVQTQASSIYKTNKLYVGDGTGQFTYSTTFTKWPEPLLDINGDSYPDEITTQNNLTVIKYGNPDGGTNYVPQIIDIPEKGLRIVDDFNNDSLLDIMIIDSGLGSNANAYLYNQTGIPTPPVSSNLSPVWSPLSDAGIFVGQPLNVNISGYANDPEGFTLIFSKASGPAWITVQANGTIEGTPTSADVGINTLIVRARDIKGAFQETSILINVLDNNPPVWSSINDGALFVGTPLEANVSGFAADADGDAITFSKVSGPAWITVYPDGGVGGAPSISDVGVFDLILSATDTKGASNQITVRLWIRENL